MIERIWNGTPIQIQLSQNEIDFIYEKQTRTYWEADFINRCIDRKSEEIGFCNLLYETLTDDELLLSQAYHIYQEKQDCNISYNDTLDQVIDLLEAQIAADMYSLPMKLEVPV